MKRILSTLILFLSLSCAAQDGFTALMPQARPISGQLIAGNTYTNAQKIAVLQDSFHNNRIRISISLYDWPHAFAPYTAFANAGLHVILNVNWECASLPCAYPTNMTLYAARLNSLLDTLPVDPEIVVIENEEFNDAYHSTAVLPFYITELQTAAAICHARGLKVANAGMTGTDGGMDILVFRYLKAKYGSTVATLYGNATMRPFQVTAANNPGSNPTLEAKADSVQQALTAYSTIVDYINVHDLYEPIDPNISDTVTTLTPYVIRRRQEYIASFTKKATMSNETGQKNLGATLVTNMLQRYIDASFPYVIWYNGDGSGAVGAMGLNEDTSPFTLRANGTAYQTFFLTHLP